MLRTILSLVAATALTSTWGATAVHGQGAKPEPVKKLTAADQIAEALGKKITVDYNGQSLQEVLQHVSKKTGIPIAVDLNMSGVYYAFPVGGMGFGGPPMPGGIGIGVNGGGGQVKLKIENAPLGTALKQFLQTRHLTWVIVGGKLAVTSEPQALALQMKQPVDLDLSKVPMKEALRDLAKTTGTQFVLDPGTNQGGDYEVTLKLDGVTLDTAVRLMAFKAGLKAVRVNNVWVVTSAKAAANLPAETALPAAAAPHLQDVDQIPMAPGGGIGPDGAPIFPMGVPMPGVIPANPAGIAPAPPAINPMPMREGGAPAPGA
jgi:type II secretory pathway component GspD/PulD (secretin)